MTGVRAIREQPLLYFGLFISLVFGSMLVAATTICLSADAQYQEQTGRSSDFGVLLGYVAMICGFMTVSVVMTSCSFMVRLRRRELGLLRLLGASGSRIVLGELTQMLLLALVAAGVGSLLALAAAPILFAAAHHWGLTETTLSVTGVWPAIVFAGTVSGTAAALGGYLPARRAAKISPLAALRAADMNMQPRSLWRLVLGTCCGIGGVVMIAVVRPDVPVLAMLVGICAPPLLTFMAVAWSPWVMPGLAAILLRPSSGIDPVAYAARLNTRSSSPAVAALAAPVIAMIAISGGLALTIDTSELLTERALTRDLIASVVVSGPAAPRAEPGVSVNSPLLSEFTLRGDGFTETATVMGIDPQAYTQTWRDAARVGALDDLGPGTVAIGKFEASDRGLGLGSVLAVRMPDGHEQQLQVVALINDDAGVAPPFAMSRDEVAAHDAQAGVEYSFLSGEAAVEDFPGAMSPQEWIAATTGEIRDENTIVLAVLLIPPCLYGLLSMVNTVMMRTSVRGREFRLARRLGFEPDQVVAMVRYEVIATVGAACIAGAVIGVGMGAFVRQMVLHDGLEVFLRPEFFGLLALGLVGGLLTICAATVASRNQIRSEVS